MLANGHGSPFDQQLTRGKHKRSRAEVHRRGCGEGPCRPGLRRAAVDSLHCAVLPGRQPGTLRGRNPRAPMCPPAGSASRSLADMENTTEGQVDPGPFENPNLRQYAVPSEAHALRSRLGLLYTPHMLYRTKKWTSMKLFVHCVCPVDSRCTSGTSPQRTAAPVRQDLSVPYH